MRQNGRMDRSYAALRQAAVVVHAGALGLLLALAGCSGGGASAPPAGGGAGGAAPVGAAGAGARGASGGAGGHVLGSGGVPAGSGGGAAGASGPDAGAAGGAGGAGGDVATCVWTLGSGSEVAAAPPTKNNSVDLRGPAIGEVPFVAATARRVVPVKVGVTLPGLTVGQAYLTAIPGSAQSSMTVQLTIPVVNQGTDRPCFVKAQNLHYLSATAATLNASSDDIYVNGSVGDVGSSTFYSHNCLAPGETGYLLDTPPSAYFSATSSIELDLAFLLLGQAPTGHLTPKLYELGTCGTRRSVRVTAVNDGLSTVTVAMGQGRLGPGILLDDAGLPAGWIYLADEDAAQLAPGGQPVYFFSSDLSTSAAVTRVQIFLHFDPPM